MLEIPLIILCKVKTRKHAQTLRKLTCITINDYEELPGGFITEFVAMLVRLYMRMCFG